MMIISTLINCRTQELTLCDSDVHWEIALWIEQLGFDHVEQILIPTPIFFFFFWCWNRH